MTEITVSIYRVAHTGMHLPNVLIDYRESDDGLGVVTCVTAKRAD